MVDKRSSKPLYLQIQTVLEQRILSGEWKSGDKVMSENQISAEYKVSRVTARQAIEQLIAKNMLFRSPGKGTFVTNHDLPFGFSAMMSFSRSLQSKGFSVETRILDEGIFPAPEEVATKLRLEIDTEVVIVRRLRIVNDIPAAIHTSYFNARIFAKLLEIDLTVESILEAAERISGTFVAYSQDSLRAVPALLADADLLQVPPGTPMMELEGVVHDEQNIPCRYTKGLYRGDLFRLDVRNSRTSSTALVLSNADYGGESYS